MFSILLKAVLRSFLRYKSFTLINLSGLTAGLLAFLAIMLYVRDEYSFDSFHTHKDRIIRAVCVADFGGQVHKWGAVPNQLAVAVKEIPEVEQAARVFHHNFGDIAFIATATDHFSENNLFYADPSIFDIFSITMLRGNAEQVLDAPGKVMVSESAAKKYFGDADPIGQLLTVDGRTELQVTGVYQDFPENSLLKGQLIASFASNYFGKEERLSWGNASFETFMLLQESAPTLVVEQKIEAMLEKSIPRDDRWFTISLQPLLDVHLHSGDMSAQIDHHAYGDLRQVKILIALSIVIMLIASINYMSLATAQSQRRSKEVGVSKTLGASGVQLKSRFYFEAAFFVLTSMVISLLLLLLLLPSFNALSGKNLTPDFLSQGWFWLSFVALWMVLTLLSGSYPALYLSSFSPRLALAKAKLSGGQTGVRKGLVVVQFTASFILIVTTIIFYRQMQFIRDKNLGYEPEQVVAVMTSAADDTQVSSLKLAYEALPGVKSVCRSQSYPGIGSSGYTIRGDGQDQSLGASIITTRATSEVLDVLGIKLLAGRTLPEHKEEGDTTMQIVINKSAADYLGLSPADAIGTDAYIFNGRPSEIVGVTEDFHFTSLHDRIGLYCFNNNTDNRYIYLLVKVATKDLPSAMASLEETYEKIVPTSFVYAFLDEKMNALYKSEQATTKVVMIASLLAVLIACMGLYALSAYTADQRIKEIGIRKVLGASVGSLVALLSRDFMILVAIAFVIGVPLSYYAVEQWLSTFAYRTEIGILAFVLASLLVALIAWLTVSVESVRTALRNPATSLRNE